MFDTLLFFHVLAAFMLGATGEIHDHDDGSGLWDVGGLGTLVFGVWLALYVDGYELWDGWILAAIVLWAIATELGRRARDVAVANFATLHWLRTLAVVLLLADMVWKPGA